jgi:hypothetical protein
MKLGWTLNVVIMEADLTMDLREWYMKAAEQFGWSKIELTTKIADQAHLEIVLNIKQTGCGTVLADQMGNEFGFYMILTISFVPMWHGVILERCRGEPC